MRSHAKAASAATTDDTGMTRSVLSWLLLGALACATLLASASPAAAATPSTSYGYKGEIIGTPDTTWFSFGQIHPIAVSNDDGRVFIARQFDFALDILESDGTEVARQSTGGAAASAIGVSADGSDLFIADEFAAVFGTEPALVKYTSDGAPTPTYTEDPGWTPSIPVSGVRDIAVDPTTGDLLVAASGGTYRFDADSGALLSFFDGSSADRGAFAPIGIAVAANGDVYAIVSPGRVEHMGADGSWKGELKVPDPGDAISAPGIAVNPQNGDVAVLLPQQGGEWVLKIYAATNSLKDTIHLPPAVAEGVSNRNRDLAYSPDGTKLYVGRPDGSAQVLVLGTRPGVDPPVATEITTAGAHLTAAVATGGESTAARIEYCVPTDPCENFLGSDGESPWQVVSEETGLSDPAQDTISGDISGLESNTEYLLRATAVNEESQVEGISATGSFTTALVPPSVQTGAADSLTDISARLNGTIGTFGGQTTYHFEYGLTTAYGNNAPAGAEAIAGNERSTRTFTQTVKGLQPATTYHYRLVASNAAGTTFGEDRSFTTLSADEVAPQRGFEMVTPQEKKGLSIYANFGFQASADGSAIVYTASAASSEASSAVMASRYMSRRTPKGWLGQRPLDPPINPIRAITFAINQATSADFEHTFVVSQKALTPDAIEGAGNFYVNDIDTGAYHLIGSATQPGAFSGLVGPLSVTSFIAGAPDFSWIVLISRYPLLPGAPQVGMYKWSSTDGLSLVSLLPDGSAPSGNTWFQSNTRTTNRLASDDGETFAFSLVSGEKGVYRRSEGQTEAISVSQATGGPAGPQPGIADGMSRDGRYVVFHSGAQLTDSATDGGQKMYRYDASSGEVEYLGSLDVSDDGSPDVLGISDDGGTVYFNSNNETVVWREGQQDSVFPAPLRAATVGFPSPNGRYFILASGGAAHLYDAVSGEATCVSCLTNGPSDGGLPDRDRNLSNRVAQVVTDDGRAYFMSRTPLVGSDRNGTVDVYEYFKGRLALISPGDRDFDATLADISPDGSTVFFTTAEGLVGQDTDEGFDLYAARVGGGFPEPPTAPAQCSGEACRSSESVPPTPPNLGSSSSKKTGSKPAAVRCRKGTHKVKKNGKARCVKNKHQNKKRDTKNNRGASR